MSEQDLCFLMARQEKFPFYRGADSFRTNRMLDILYVRDAIEMYNCVERAEPPQSSRERLSLEFCGQSGCEPMVRGRAFPLATAKQVLEAKICNSLRFTKQEKDLLGSVFGIFGFSELDAKAYGIAHGLPAQEMRTLCKRVGSMVKELRTSEIWREARLPVGWTIEDFERQEPVQPPTPGVVLSIQKPIVVRCDSWTVLDAYSEYFGHGALLFFASNLFDDLNDRGRWMRAILIYLYFEYTTMSSKEICQAVGLKSVSSIYRWRNEVRSIEDSPEIRKELDEIKLLIISKLEERKAA